MRYKRQMICALICTLGILLAACDGGEGNTPKSSESPDTQATWENQTGDTAGEQTGYEGELFTDEFCGYSFQIPIWGQRGYLGSSYYIEHTRQDGAGTDAILGIANYNEAFDAESYDISGADTAAEALDVLYPKIGELMNSYCSMKLSGAEYNSTETAANQCPAVKFSGTFTFTNLENSTFDYAVTGYCIQGANHPVLCFVVDMSGDPAQTEAYSSLLDEVASTFVDGN